MEIRWAFDAQLITKQLTAMSDRRAGRGPSFMQFELQGHSDAEDMQRLLETEYAGFAGVLAAKKAAGHRNPAGTTAVIKDDDEAPAA
jgi:hypothetical protein